jgi:hypothetical protein
MAQQYLSQFTTNSMQDVEATASGHFSTATLPHCPNTAAPITSKLADL